MIMTNEENKEAAEATAAHDFFAQFLRQADALGEFTPGALRDTFLDVYAPAVKGSAAAALKSFARLKEFAWSHLDPEQAAQFEQALRDTVKPELEKRYQPYSAAAFKKEVLSYDPSKEFRPQGMQGVHFQPGTMNLICARPSRGKTTLMISLFCDAARQFCPGSAGEREVFFLTLEETPKQIYSRLALYALFEEAFGKGYAGDLPEDDTRAELFKAVKAIETGGKWTLKGDLRPAYEAALSSLAETEKQARVIDFSALTVRDLEIFMGFHPGAVIFIDYMTLIQSDSKEDHWSKADMYEDISKRITQAAKDHDVILITAAQLRRLSEGAGDSDQPDQLNDTLLKECGQFEQDANTIIALGRTTDIIDDIKEIDLADCRDPGEPLYFWKIVKNRDGGGVNTSFCFNTTAHSMGYSSMTFTKIPAAFINLKSVHKNAQGKAKGKAKEEAGKPQQGTTGATVDAMFEDSEDL